MQELLVIFACLGSHGCSETSSTYYHYHPELREFVEYNERRVKEYVGPVVVESVAPAAFFIMGGTGSFKIVDNLRLQMKQYEDVKIIYSKGF